MRLHKRGAIENARGVWFDLSELDARFAEFDPVFNHGSVIKFKYSDHFIAVDQKQSHNNEYRTSKYINYGQDRKTQKRRCGHGTEIISSFNLTFVNDRSDV